MNEMEAMRAEIRRAYPPLTRAQGEARQRAFDDMAVKYPGQFVGYVDTWAGDGVSREVVAAAADWDEYQAQLALVRPEVRGRVETTHLPELDVFECPGLWFDDENAAEVA